MRQRPVHPPHMPSAGSSPRSPMISSYSSKKSVPSIPYIPNTIYDQAAANQNQYLIISPIPLNRVHKSTKPGMPPAIVKPKAEPNQKRGKEKSSDRIPKRSLNLKSLSGHDLNRKYQNEIQEIENLMNQLIHKHPQNEDYYRKHYQVFLKILNEAAATNSNKIPIVINATKYFFEGLLNSQFRRLRYNFRLEEKLRKIISKENENNENNIVLQEFVSEVNEDFVRSESMIDEYDDDDNENSGRKDHHNGDPNKDNDDYLNKLDKSTRDKYEKEIREIRDLMNQLIKKHPENEAYYRGLFDSFMNAIKEAEQTNSSAIPEIIQATRAAFESLLNGNQSKLGYSLDDKLKSIVNDKYLDKLSQSTRKKYEKEIREVRDLMNQLIKKHPENEAYYRGLFDSFINAIKEAEQTNSSAIPEIIKATKEAFENLLNGKQSKLDYDLEDKLKSIIDSKYLDELSQSTRDQYGEQIKEIRDLMNKLIKKHPENEDYYRGLFDSFMKALKEAEQTNSSAIPEIIQTTKTAFENLLNGDQDKLDYDLDDKLQSILKGDDDKYLDELSQSTRDQYGEQIGEIRDLMNQLIKKHPENEAYYRGLFDSFMNAIKEAEQTNSSAIPEIIQTTKTAFENLLNSDQDKLDYNLEDKLKSIVDDKYLDELSQSTRDQYGEQIKEIRDLMNQLIKKHPENEDYYRGLFDSFMKALKEAEQTNSSAIPEIIQTTKTIFENLINGDQDKLDYDLEDKLKSIVEANNKEDDKYLDELDQSTRDQYGEQIKEVRDLMNQLIKKHPENEAYYRGLFDSFINAVKEAEQTNSSAIPEIIKAAKEAFENLLNGDQDKLDYDFDDKLKSIVNEDLNKTTNIRDGSEYSSTTKLPQLAEDPEEGDDQGGTTEKSNESEDKKALSDIEEIEALLQKLIEKHPENEDFYRKLFDAFMGVIKEASAANSPDVPGLARVTKLFFEELLNGDHDKIDFNIEDKLREILSSVRNNKENNEENENSSSSKYGKEIGEVKELVQKLIDKHPENEDYYRKLLENFLRVIKEAEESNNPAAPEIIEATKSILENLLNGEEDKLDFDLEDKLRSILNSNEDDKCLNELEQSTRDQYGEQIGEVRDLMNQLIKKHPENEDYYRGLFDSFMNAVKEAEQTNSSAIPEIIKAAKEAFENLLNGDQDKLDYDFDNKLKSIISNEQDESESKKALSDIEEIEALLQKLIEKHPENEDFYRKLFDAFMGVIKEASAANSPDVPGLARVTKLFFEELLNGDHDKIDFNIEDKLREILSSVRNNNSNDENDNENNKENNEEDENSSSSKYGKEIGEVKELVQKLIDKHPENEDYYRKLLETFLRVIKEAEESNNPAAPEIIEATKSILENLLNGEEDKLDFDLEDKLRSILESANEQDQSPDHKKEVEDLLQKLIEKHPENEDYYRKLYEAFMRVIKEAEDSNNPAAPEIARVAKSVFESLLNGDQDKLDYDLEDRLRSLLESANDKKEVEDLLQKLIDKHPENEDYYRKLYEAFMRVIKEAEDSNDPAAAEIARAAKSIFENLLNGDQDKLDYDLEEKLRSISDGLYKPYNEISDGNEEEANEMTDEMILREAEKISSQKVGTKFEKLYPPPRATTLNKRSGTVPNYQTIINALRFTSLPGPRHTELVESIINMMKESKEERFVLLMASRTQKFKGVYILADDALSARKLWGQGPSEVKSEDCCTFYKYLNGQKQFDILEVKGFTPTTDGFSMKKKLEPDTW